MPPTTLEICLFGDFSLRYDGTLVTAVNTARMQSLLAYLLLNRHEPQARQKLSFLFWPDSSEAQARTNLRKLFYQLRQALPAADEVLHADAHYLQWRATAVYQLDVARFADAIDTANVATLPTERHQQLKIAAHMYQGQLLRHCYDDWIVPVRETYHQSFIQALLTLTALLEAERDYAAAIGYTQQLLQFEPLQEVAYRQLMRLHTLNGNRALALKTYHTCATVLEEELGVRPTAATQRDYEALLQQERSAAPPILEADSARLVGRASEWATLQSAWQATTAGQMQLIVISGEAGIGKSRLAEELVKWARRQGIFTAAAHAYAGSNETAYTPLVAWLQSDQFQRALATVEDIWLVELARLLPEILIQRPDLPQPGPLTEGWQQRRFFEAIAQVVIGSGKPKLLVLDDLQWCDSETIAWLRYLIHVNPHAPLLFVATLRVEAAIRSGACHEFLGVLSTQNQLIELSLLPLTEAETATLAQQTAGHLVDAAALAQLFQETEGNPLYIVEMTRLIASRTSTTTDASVRAIVTAPALPAKVQTILEQRLHALSPTARVLAAFASVVGRSFTLPVLAAATHLDEDQLITGLDELWQRRIVLERAADAYDFSHGKLRDVAYHTLSLTRRRLYHRKIAAALTTIYPSQSDQRSFEIGYHYEMAGRLQEAVTAYRQAATAAQRIYANQTAIVHLQRILALLSASDPAVKSTVEFTDELAVEPAVEPALNDAEWRHTTRLQVTELLADLHAFTGQHDVAITHYQQALAEPVPATSGVDQARMLLKLGKLFTVMRQNPEALACYEQAEARLAAPLPERSAQTAQTWLQIQLERLNTYYWLNEWQAAATLLEQVRPVVEQQSTPQQQAGFFLALNALELRRNRYLISDENLTYCRRALAIFQADDDQNGMAWAGFVLGFCLLWYRDTVEAEAEITAALTIAEAAGDLVHQARCLTYLTIAYRQLGRVDDTEQYATKSLATAESVEMVEYQGTARANLGWVAWRNAAWADAERHAQAALTLWEASPDGHASCCFQWTARWPLIALAVAQGEHQIALDHIRQILVPPQQRLSDPLWSLLTEIADISSLYHPAEPQTIQPQLENAINIAQQLHYL